MERIPVAGPWITEKEIRYVTDAVTNAWYSEANIYHERFEKAFAEYVGVPFAVALPSCTSAIHLSLLALGVGPGDEVIVPEITWIASAAPISYVGATPVFADIDPRTWCLAIPSFKGVLSPRTKAVIPVDLYGNMPDMDAMRTVAEERGIAIVEDAAQAIGAEYKGKKAGGFGDTGVFSFHGSKTLTTGEGGMLITSNKSIHERVLFLRDHGRRPGDKSFVNTEIAYKYKMSSMQAALGLGQLERIEELLARKRQIFHWYQDELAHVEGLTLNYEMPGTKSSYWMVTIVLDPESGVESGQLMTWLGAENIDCRPFFHPLSSLPAYQKLEQAKEARQVNRVSYQISRRALNLPSALNLNRERVKYVCERLKAFLQPRPLK